MDQALIMVSAFIVLTFITWFLFYPVFKRLTNELVILDICRVLRKSETQIETIKFVQTIKGLPGVNGLEHRLSIQKKTLADYLIHASSIAKKINVITNDQTMYDQTIWRIYKTVYRSDRLNSGLVVNPRVVDAFNMAIDQLDQLPMDRRILICLLLCTTQHIPSISVTQ